MGILHPHFRAKDPEGSLQLVGHADAAGADFLHPNPDTLDFSRCQLVEGHGIAFQHHTFIIQEQQADIVFLEEIPQSCCQLSQILHGLAVEMLPCGKICCRQSMIRVNPVRRRAKAAAFLPGCCNLRIYIRIQLACFHI